MRKIKENKIYFAGSRDDLKEYMNLYLNNQIKKNMSIYSLLSNINITESDDVIIMSVLSYNDMRKVIIIAQKTERFTEKQCDTHLVIANLNNNTDIYSVSCIIKNAQNEKERKKIHE